MNVHILIIFNKFLKNILDIIFFSYNLLNFYLLKTIYVIKVILYANFTLFYIK